MADYPEQIEHGPSGGHHGMTGERAVRLLRAKAAELENRYAKGAADSYADIALIASLLADHMERQEGRTVLLEAHSENLIERVYELEGGDKLDPRFDADGNVIPLVTDPNVHYDQDQVNDNERAQKHRILWNRRGEDIDEIVFDHPRFVHIEQMNDRCWWIGVDLPGGGYWAGNFQATSRGKMTFSEQEGTGFEWDNDATHEVKDG